MFSRSLGDGYHIRELPTDEFGPLCTPLAKAIFDDQFPFYRHREALSEAELAKVGALRERMGDPYRLNLGLFHGDEFVGWSWGFQESSETYYMCNSAVLPAHRGRGLYQALVAAVVEITTEKGFQKLYSRHLATNNAVIVPKLKAGFVITGLELSDIHGSLVLLSYFPHPLRRKVLEYRVGQAKPDDEIKARLQL